MLHHQCPHPYHRTKHRRLIERGFVLIFAVGLVLFFAIGRFSVMGVDEYKVENESLQTSVSQLTKENKELAKQQDFAESSKKIDLLAEQDLRRLISSLHDELSDAKEQLAFYQRVVAPETIIKGLYVNSFKVSKEAEPETYRYKLIIAQGANQKKVVKGRYFLLIRGELEGDNKVLSLNKKGGNRFYFRYYQILEDEIKLPKGFVPRQIDVSIIPSTKNVESIKQQWLWNNALDDS